MVSVCVVVISDLSGKELEAVLTTSGYSKNVDIGVSIDETVFPKHISSPLNVRTVEHDDLLHTADPGR